MIYAGAGVTIDRSSIGWRQLISGLMETFVPTEESRNKVFEAASDLQAASTAVRLYQNAHGDDYRDRLTDRLRVTLYNSEDWRVGSLATNLVNLMFALNQRQIDESGLNAPGSCIVTPNYDDYIWSEVETISKASRPRLSRKRWDSKPQLQFPTNVEPLGIPGRSKVKLSSWISDDKFPQAGDAPCVHLHGFVARSHSGAGKNNDTYRHPVVSEQDYFDTQANSYGALKKLFGQSSVLIVGASMTDPPLLRALADTAIVSAEQNLVRYAIVVMENDLNAADKTELQRLLRERYVHFNVEPIFLDYYGQIAQFVHEISVAARFNDPWHYAASEKRYGRRLATWWKKWIAIASDPSTDNEFLFHEILDLIQTAVASLLEAGADEYLKVELWVRWAPRDHREMRLWATSIGTLSYEHLMRRGNLSSGSEYTSIRALLAGRPVMSEVPAGKDEQKRWRTYLSVPIKVQSGGAEIPVAVITVASMSPRAHSAIDPSKNKDLLVKAINMISDSGVILATPSQKKWDDYRDELESVIYEIIP
ncbi:hypothetical protein C5B95_07315 [Rathayibacter sp. AY1A7]|nr:hypothetical protein C5B95_07315 [Rathayibacter sp. AY1A7]